MISTPENLKDLRMNSEPTSEAQPAPSVAYTYNNVNATTNNKI